MAAPPSTDSKNTTSPATTQPSPGVPAGGQPPVVIMSSATKVAPSSSPYDEFCPNCQKTVRTQTAYICGACAIIALIIGLIFIIPLLLFCCGLCCRDVEHSCPQCRTVLSTRKAC